MYAFCIVCCLYTGGVGVERRVRGERVYIDDFGVSYRLVACVYFTV